MDRPTPEPLTPPVTPSAPPPRDPGSSSTSVGRQVALGTIVFVASLVVLLGLTGVVGRAPASGPPAVSTDVAVATATSTATTSADPGDSTTPSASGGGDGEGSPLPSPTATGDPILVGAGDIANCDSDGDEATAKLLDGIDGQVFTAGDNVYPAASESTFADCYEPSWGRHLARTRAAAGNHDWQSDGIGAYRDYFGPSSAGPDGETWYAYDLGAWRVIVLDSDCEAVDGCGPTSPQGRWLADELATNDGASGGGAVGGAGARCTVAIWHHPRFSSGFHGNEPSVGAFWRALYAAGVDVVINGHDHDYERFAPQDPSGTEDRERGIREFVVGTGGRPLRDFEEPRRNSELRASVDHGVLALALRDGSYDWQFHAATTDFSDRGTAFCH
jgi:hypothetical protein